MSAPPTRSGDATGPSGGPPDAARSTAPAIPWARVLAQARFDAATFVRNGEQLLVSMVLPAIALVGITLAPFPDLGGRSRVEFAMPGVLALAILSSAFTGQAIGTAFDRRYGVLRLLGTTPLGRDGFVAGRCLAVLVVQVLQFAVIGVVGLVLGWRLQAGALPGFVVFWLVGSATFVALALLFAGTLRAEAVLALANLLWVIMAGAGGVMFSEAHYPEPWHRVVSLLPPGALGDGMRAAWLDHALALGPLAVLVVWGVLLGVLTVRFFRWSD
ncbi:MAG: ABC transporter permease [Dermatophilaceae bacterium]